MKLKIVLASDKDHSEALKRTGFWGARAAGCIFLARSTGRLMLAHRSDAVQEPNTWGTWGGAMDGREGPKSAVLREVKEEAGYQGKVKLLPLAVFTSGTFKYHNFLAVVADEFEPELNWETQGHRWFRPGRWPRPLHPGMKFLLANSTADIVKAIEEYGPQASTSAGDPQYDDHSVDGDALQTQYNEIKRSGHGRVIKTPDGCTARCWGPNHETRACSVCLAEKEFLARYNAHFNTNTVERSNLSGDDKDI